jgi:hypothetical protein
MQTSISNPVFTVKEVGKLIKNSKKVFTWEFTIENTPFKLDFFHSKVSNKRRLNLNGNKILETKDYTNEFKFNFMHKDKRFCIYQINLTMYDLSINDIIFSRLLEGDKPSPEAGVKNETTTGAEVLEENIYPDLPVESFNVYESIVSPEFNNRQSLIDELFGESTMIDSLSTAQTTGTTPVMSSKLDVKAIDEEVKEVGNYEVFVPHRSNTSKSVNLLEFEPVVPKKKISEMLYEIDFFAKEQPKVDSKFNQNKKNMDVKYFVNLLD